MNKYIALNLGLIVSTWNLWADRIDIRADLPSFATDYSPIVWRDGTGIIIDRLGWTLGETPANRPHFIAFSESGAQTTVRLSIPDAAHLRVYDVAALPRLHRFVISASAVGPDHTLAAMLIFVNSSGQVERITQTNPILPQKLAVSPDGTIWALGIGDLTLGEGSRTPETVFHFNQGGQLMKKAMPAGNVASWPAHPASYRPEAGQPFIGVSQTTVGVYYAVTRELVEFSYDGVVTRRWAIQPPVNPFGEGLPRVSGMALTDGGRLFSSLQFGGRTGLFELDRTSSRWQPITTLRDGQPVPGALVGWNHDDLICLAISSPGQLVYRHVQPVTLASPKAIAMRY